MKWLGKAGKTLGAETPPVQGTSNGRIRVGMDLGRINIVYFASSDLETFGIISRIDSIFTIFGGELEVLEVQDPSSHFIVN